MTAKDLKDKTTAKEDLMTAKDLKDKTTAKDLKDRTTAQEHLKFLHQEKRTTPMTDQWMRTN
jgi:hypothetical protein